ncbi:hypothetical protein ACH4PU_32590 [Streptomyces sp. NPDC021100]|uniref:hypothetical protein n=1 Tax=Streptomyces sp. NPDC021100 TaxID=3365114 RepID=UPI00378C9645
MLAAANAGSLSGGSLSPELAGLLVIPWIACVRCGQLLGRAHEREPWGDLSLLPTHYVIVHLREPAQPRLFPPTALREAFATLKACR